MDGGLPLWFAIPAFLMIAIALFIVGRSIVRDYRSNRK
jgi:hypothetical protein